MHLAILVVTYNSSPAESTTLRSILQADLSALSSVQMTIWNNGPALFADKELAELHRQVTGKNIPTTVYNTTGNFSLSKIYNQWLKQNIATHYIIFDHDDIFEKNFFTKLSRTAASDVIVPILQELNTRAITSPTLRTFRKSPNYFPVAEGIFTGEKISALTSGLCISKKFVDKFTEIYSEVFNESFALYRIDVCFFNDLSDFLKKDTNTSVAIMNTVQHCQSEFTRESSAMSHFRILEHIYSGCLIRIHSRKKSRRSALKFILSRCLPKFANGAELYTALKCAILKRHPKVTRKHDIEFFEALQTNKIVMIKNRLYTRDSDHAPHYTFTQERQ